MSDRNIHKPMIGAGVLAIDTHTGKFLLGRRGLGGSCPNCWAPFGGTFEEKDGYPKTTAMREFKEESNCNTPYKILNSPFYINKDNHLTFYTYLGLFDGICPVTISHESLEYGWFDLEELPSNLLPGFKELLTNKWDDLKEMTDRFKEEHKEKSQEKQLNFNEEEIREYVRSLLSEHF